LTGSGPHRGFVLSRDGVFTTIDYPGATSTYALGMNSRGDILGSYTFDDNVSTHISVACFPQPDPHTMPAEMWKLIEPASDGCETLKFKVRRENVAALCRTLLERFTVTDISIEDISVEEVIRQLFLRSRNDGPW